MRIGGSFEMRKPGNFGLRKGGSMIMPIGGGIDADTHHLPLPIKLSEKWIRNDRCLSQRRVAVISHFLLSLIGVSAAAGSPFLGYFFGRDKKSDWLSAPPTSNH